jgi:hypothetical protein
VTLEHSFLVEALGWVATATFVASYLARRADTLVHVQIAGALLWVVYGLLVRSGPVIAANVLVVGAAAWKARTPAKAAAGPGAGARADAERRVETSRGQP